MKKFLQNPAQKKNPDQKVDGIPRNLLRQNFMKKAIAESLIGFRKGHGGPFGAIIVQDGKIIASGHNQVLSTLDPTAHAEVVVIREACLKLGRFQLEGCELYTSCEPCPMCLSAAYWAKVDKIYFGNTRRDAAAIGFGDDLIYSEFTLPRGKRKIKMVRLLGKEALAGFKEWKSSNLKIHYGPEV